MSCIYIIKNTINDKVYIGQTKSTAEKRFKGHKTHSYLSKSKTCLTRALLKHGTENFYVETLIEGEFDKSKLNELETFYIKEYNSVAPSGYNLQTGGLSYDICDETRLKMCEAQKLRAVEISENFKRLWENEEYRAIKISNLRKKRGKYTENRKPHPRKLRLELDMELIKKLFEQGNNAHQISKLLNCTHGAIIRRLKDLNILGDYNQEHRLVLKLDNEYIKKLFEEGIGIRKIAKLLNCSHTAIRRRLKDMGLLQKPRKTKYSELNNEIINSLFKEGMTVAELSRYFNVSRDVIKARIQK